MRILIALLLTVTSANAATVENDTFTCFGNIIVDTPGHYSIRSEDDHSDDPMVCMFDRGAVSQRILERCHEGERCEVRARGVSGNGNYHLIQKVFFVKKQ